MKKIVLLLSIALASTSIAQAIEAPVEDVSLRDIAESLVEASQTQSALRSARLQALSDLRGGLSLGELFDLIDQYQENNSEAIQNQISALTELREKIDLWKEQNNVNTPRLDALREQVRGQILDALAQYQAYRDAYENVGNYTESVGEILADLRDYQPGDVIGAVSDYIQLLRETFRPDPI